MGKVLGFKSCAKGGEYTGFGAVTPSSYHYIGVKPADITAAYAGTNLDGLVTGIGNGWQKYEVPTSGKIKFSVRGAAGGNNSNTGFTIDPATGASSGSGGIPGRGAKLEGEGKFVKGDILYILVGIRGWCNKVADWGGGGGGASAVLLDNPAGKYTFAPLNRKVDVLFVAGGGGGTFDSASGGNYNGKDAVVTNGTSTNGGSSYKSGGGAGLTDNGGSSASQGCAYSLLSGSVPNSSFNAPHNGGWGGGGAPYDGGGGGGGYSGGNATDSQGGYGGTSYINPNRITETFRGYATVEADSARNLTNPWSAYGYVELTLGRSETKYILAQDEDGYKWFDGINDLNEDTNPTATGKWILLNDQNPPEELTYITYGDTIITNAIGLKNNVKFLVASHESDEAISISAHANGTIFKQNKDFSLSDVSLIKSIAHKGNLTNLEVKFAVSKDSGKTWQTYAPGGWIDIDISDKEIFKTQGYSLSQLSTIPLADWNAYKSPTIEFAFSITQNGNNGNVIIETVSIISDLVGSWRHYKESEATYEYISDTEFRVTFLEGGNYKVNYLDSITNSN